MSSDDAVFVLDGNDDAGHEVLRRTCPLLGVKQTSLFALHMSAFDPKRTSVAPSRVLV